MIFFFFYLSVRPKNNSLTSKVGDPCCRFSNLPRRGVHKWKYLQWYWFVNKKKEKKELALPSQIIVWSCSVWLSWADMNKTDLARIPNCIMKPPWYTLYSKLYSLYPMDVCYGAEQSCRERESSVQTPCTDALVGRPQPTHIQSLQ